MNTPDPFELLQRSNPIRAHASEPGDDALLERILSTPVTPATAAHPRHKRRIIIASGLGVIALATAAFTFLSTGTASNPAEVACHRSADLASDSVVVAFSGDPVRDCDTPWTSGLFGVGAPPPLQACVGSNSVIEVYPGDADVCARLGLARLKPGNADAAGDNDKQLALIDQLSDLFVDHCVGRDAAAADTERAIRDVGLSDWSVQVRDNYTADRPCTAFIAEPSTKTVTLGGRLDISSQATNP